VTLSPGNRLGPYEVVAPLGAGGMGEVYRAPDLNLKRDVAVKVLPEDLYRTPELLARFQREAEILASLNHPNIASIYGMEESGLVRCLILEVVDGEVLSNRLSRGPLPLDEALRVAAMIASAFESAHEKGILHRDLKPGNVMLTNDGTPKVIDFGLATAFSDPAAGPSSLSQSPTMMSQFTGGSLMGTAAYMSPEQARGKPVDGRADVWAFGCTLFEMLSGKQAFAGETLSDTIAAILDREPDSTLLPVQLPPIVRYILRGCLQKDVRQRLKSFGDIRLALESAASLEPVPQTPAGFPNWKRRANAERAVGLVLILGLLVLLFVLQRPTAKPAPVDAAPTLRAELQPPSGLVFAGGGGPATPSIAVSPDGKWIAFTSGNRIFIRPTDSVFAEHGFAILNSDGGGNLAAKPVAEGSLPFWSPDSKNIGFVAGQKLKTIGINGGPPQTLADVGTAPQGASWGIDGRIIYSPAELGKGVMQVATAGGVAKPASQLRSERHELSHLWPKFLPDGKHFLFYGQSSDAESRGTFIGSLDSDETRPLIRGAWAAAFAPPSHVLFVRDGNLYAQRLDLSGFALEGEPSLVAEHIASNPGNGRGAFSVSNNGVLIYRHGELGGRAQRRLWWSDRTGKEVDAGFPLGYYGGLGWRMSPDGAFAAIGAALETGFSDIQILDLNRRTSQRLTHEYLRDAYPVWNPDGKQIVFSSNRSGIFNLFAIGAKGENERLYFESPGDKLAQDWSTDGNSILFQAVGEEGVGDIWMYSVPEVKARPLVETPFNETDAQFSPDGKWFTYTSDDTIWAQPFPPDGRKWRVSPGNGTQAQWNPAANEIFYLSAGKLFSAKVQLTSDFKVSEPVALFPLSGLYAVAADGKRFLISRAENVIKEQVMILLNWHP